MRMHFNPFHLVLLGLASTAYAAPVHPSASEKELVEFDSEHLIPKIQWIGANKGTTIPVERRNPSECTKAAQALHLDIPADVFHRVFQGVSCVIPPAEFSRAERDGSRNTSKKFGFSLEFINEFKKSPGVTQYESIEVYLHGSGITGVCQNGCTFTINKEGQAVGVQARSVQSN